MANLQTYFRYLPVSTESRALGVYVPDAGFALVPAGAPYPPVQHPADHHFTWEKGRVLHAYQFLYITRGAGVFDSAAAGTREIKAGDLFVLHPGIWHRYRPASDTGWDEHWIEFDGDYARQLMKREQLAPAQPVLRIGLHATLLQLFRDAVDTVRRQPAEYQLILGALAVQIIAQTLSALARRSYEGQPVEEVIRDAKELLAREGGRPIGLRNFAGQLNMSYSSFRRLFKTQTGFSPRQFALEVALRRAKDLLRDTNRPIYLIADELGFQSAHYFSRFFRQRTGISPRELRQQRTDARQEEGAV